MAQAVSFGSSASGTEGYPPGKQGNSKESEHKHTKFTLTGFTSTPKQIVLKFQLQAAKSRNSISRMHCTFSFLNLNLVGKLARQDVTLIGPQVHETGSQEIYAHGRPHCLRRNPESHSSPATGPQDMGLSLPKRETRTPTHGGTPPPPGQ